MFSNLRDIPKVFRIYELLKKEDLKPTYMSLNNLLEIAIRVQNIDKLIELLKEFKKQSNFFYLEYSFKNYLSRIRTQTSLFKKVGRS